MENRAILKEWFNRVDSQATGNITAAQLKSAFAVGNLHFPVSVVQQMIRMYDFDSNGTMSFEEFVELNKFLLKEGSYLHYMFGICFAFAGSAGVFSPGEFSDESTPIFVPFMGITNNILSFDIWGRGFLAPDEASKALVKIGFSLDSPALYTVCESFDQTKSGKLRLDDFISLCIFVQSARNLFNSFDTSKQGRVTLDFNQFIYCTSNCRI